MSAIVLSAAVRSNLLSLQQTGDLLGVTQTRLATGKKVNSALDNPANFFTAAGLTNRANDLANLLDDQGQAIQTLKAADDGITSITKLIESAKAKANLALQSQSQFDRKRYSAEFNALLSQVESLAKDSGYKGKNLIGGSGNDLTVYFNEVNTSKLTISAVDFTDTTLTDGLAIDDLAEGASNTGTLTFADLAVGDVVSFTDGAGYEVGSVEITATTTAASLATEIGKLKGIDAVNAAGTLTLTSDVDLTVAAVDAAGVAQDLNGATAGTDISIDATDSGFASESAINATIRQLNSALTTLRSQASTFGTNLATVQIRQEYTKAFINTLQVGSDKLTLADSNEEGAKLLSLQTRQQLSSSALALASQSDQNVLRLLG